MYMAYVNTILMYGLGYSTLNKPKICGKYFYEKSVLPLFSNRLEWMFKSPVTLSFILTTSNYVVLYIKQQSNFYSAAKLFIAYIFIEIWVSRGV